MSLSYSDLLLLVLLIKLPPEICLIVNQGFTYENWSLSKVLGILEAELAARERAAASLPKKPLLAGTTLTAATFVAPMNISYVYCGQTTTLTSV